MLDSISRDLSFNDYNAATNTPNLNNSLSNNVPQNLTSRAFNNTLLLNNFVKKTTGDYYLTSNKKEIQLPKTKLTKNGQILLYTTKENERDLTRLRESNFFYGQNNPPLSPVSNNSSTLSAQNSFTRKFIKKNYSKKWINNVSDDFYFDLSDFVLNQKLKGTNLNSIAHDKNLIHKKAGRNTEYYINELRTKSGKDRYLKKSTYSDYLPIDFDTRFLVADSIKSLNGRKNSKDSNKTYSRIKSSRTTTSVYSHDNGLSSEDEDLTIIEDSLKTKSRLSSQPVLSAQNLINRLNFKSTATELIKRDSFGKKLTSNIENSMVTINYKETFTIDDFDNLNNSLNSEENQNENDNINDTSEIDNHNKFLVDENANNNIVKKILNKRIENNPKANYHNEIETSKIVTISSAPTYFTISKSAIVAASTPNPNNSSNNYENSYKSSRRSSVKSPKQMRKLIHSPLKNEEKQIPDGFFAREKDPSTQFISTTPVKLNTQDESKSICYNYRANQAPKSAPISRPISRPLSNKARQISSAHSKNKESKSNDKTNLPDELQPITISLIKIDDQETGHSIKVRKYYDRQALRIKKLNITSETNKLIENKKAAEYCSNLKAAIERSVEPKKSNFNLISDNFNILNPQIESKLTDRPQNKIKAQNSVNEDYKHFAKKDEVIGLKKSSNTEATLSQEIKFNNDEIEKLTNKMKDHLDELNQSISSASSNQKKPIPKSPHSSFDMNALNDDIDDSLSQAEEEAKYLSKSIEIAENNNSINKTKDHLDELNQSISSASSNKKKPIPKSPHSSFDMNALNDDIDNNLLQEEAKYLSKSIEITENNISNIVDKPSDMKEESFYDFIHKTMNDFNEVINNNDNDNKVENFNNNNEDNLVEIKNVFHEKQEIEDEIIQKSTSLMKENYNDLNLVDNKIFYDDSELILKNDKKHYTSYADVDIDTNNVDTGTFKLVSEIITYKSPDYNNLAVEKTELNNNNSNYCELNLTNENDLIEENVLFHLNGDQSVQTENHFEIKNEEIGNEIIENEKNEEVTPSNSTRELENINNVIENQKELNETVFINEGHENHAEEQLELGSFLNDEHVALNESHDSSINIKNKEILIVLTEKIKQNNSEVDHDDDYLENEKNINNLNEKKSSENLIEKQNQENKLFNDENIIQTKQQENINKVDKGLEKVKSLNNEEYIKENIILNKKINHSDSNSNQVKNLNEKSNLDIGKKDSNITMASGDNQKKVHFSNRVDVSIHKEISIDSNQEIVKQKSIEITDNEHIYDEKIIESKIIKEFVNTLTVNSNERNLNNTSPLPPATNKSAKMGSSSASASEIESNSIIKKAVKIAKGKKKASKDSQQIQQFTPEYLKELEEREKQVLLAKKNNKSAKYPHFQLPFNSEDPIADPVMYEEKFKIPDCLCPDLYNIDPQIISIEELILERRILEEKIIELRDKKLANLGANVQLNIDIPRKEEKKKSKASSKVKSIETSSKDKEMKDRIFKEERLRLQNENLKKKIEREKIFNLIIENRQQKDVEVETLNNELEINTEEFSKNLVQIEEQIKYLEKSEDDIREAIASSKSEMRKDLVEKNQLKREEKKTYFDEIREDKMFQFDVKRKELDWIRSLYKDQDEIDKIDAQITSLDIEIQKWLNTHENEIAEQEKYFDDFEEEQENKLAVLEQQQEEQALKSLKQEQYELMQEKMNLIENYEAIKTKILDRIQNIEIEKAAIDKEKKLFEEDNKNTIEQQKAKLIEILRDEHEAREKIKNELDAYRKDLMDKREKNVKLKCDLSFLKHCHFITKAFVFSYGIDWPLELFSKSMSSDKNKQGKPKAAAK